MTRLFRRCIGTAVGGQGEPIMGSTGKACVSTLQETEHTSRKALAGACYAAPGTDSYTSPAEACNGLCTSLRQCSQRSTSSSCRDRRWRAEFSSQAPHRTAEEGAQKTARRFKWWRYDTTRFAAAYQDCPGLKEGAFYPKPKPKPKRNRNRNPKPRLPNRLTRTRDLRWRHS